MNNKLFLAATVAALGLVSAAHAEPFYKAHGFYTQVEGGLNQTTDTKYTPNPADTSFNEGYVGLVAAGYSFYPGFRGELEGGYRHNFIDNPSIGGETGHERNFSIMANVLYDIPTAYSWMPRVLTHFNPYIGAGAGIGFTHTTGQVNNGTAGGVRIDDGDTQFAYQGIAGIDYAVTPQAKVGFNYRYFSTLDNEYDRPGTASETHAPYHNHEFLVGMKYTFAAPERPVVETTRTETVTRTEAPAVRAESSRVYQVFFGFDRSDLNAAGKKTVADAAMQAKAKGSTTMLDVAGHTDTKGSMSYNEALSAKRANAVKAELIKRGIPASDITIRAEGEQDQLVSTGDQTKAAENRRAVIVIK